MSEVASYISNRHLQPDNDTFHDLFEQVILSLDAGNTLFDAQESELEFGDLEKIDKKYCIEHQQAIAGQIAPIVKKDQYFWLYRIWQKEYALANKISTLAQRKKIKVLPDNWRESSRYLEGLETEKINAIEQCLSQYFTIINGGPGTGKTFTVARIVALQQHYYPDTQFALAAPTGKAAMRMEESLDAAFSQMGIKNPLQESARTLHRLLKINREGKAAFNEKNFLPYTFYIIDEASMLSLEIAASFFSAIKEESTVILLGDTEQLAAVDAGAVLHDISQSTALKKNIASLTISRRFSSNSAIGKLAHQIQNPNSHEVENLTQLLKSHSDIDWQPLNNDPIYDKLYAPYQEFVECLKTETNKDKILAQWDQYRILAAAHYGALGTKQINLEMRKRHILSMKSSIQQEVYQGMPIIITKNDYINQLYNGDIGLCLKDEKRQFSVYFPQHERGIPYHLLSQNNMKLAYAMTIHKSQGSEYENVAIVLSKQHEKLLSKELVYTGITRAKKKIYFYVTEATLQEAIDRKTNRTTGLNIFLKELNNR